MQAFADIQITMAGMDMTQASWDRRSVDWFHQMTTLPIEIQQIEFQILGAHRRRDRALKELNNQQREVENSTEVLDFLRDKFTATDLYLYLQLKRPPRCTARCTIWPDRAAGEAGERSFPERGHTTWRFLPEGIWENLHDVADEPASASGSGSPASGKGVSG